MKRDTGNFIVAVTTLYAVAFGVRALVGATVTNDYRYTGPGMVNLNVTLPGPTEFISDSGWQAITNAKTAFKNWAATEHYLDGTHQTNFLQSWMVPANTLNVGHFSNTVSQQFLGSNGYAQLPVSDVFLQWAQWTNGSQTTCAWRVSWPRAFTNDVWFADASVFSGDTNQWPKAGWGSNEYAVARVSGYDLTSAWGTLTVVGTWTTQWLHKLSVMSFGR